MQPNFNCSYCGFPSQTANDFMVICNVAKILELVVPLMEHPSETFLATIEEDLMKLIIKYGMTVNKSWSRTKVHHKRILFRLWNFIICLCRWCSIVSAVWELLSIKLLTTTNLCGLASTDFMVRYRSNLIKIWLPPVLEIPKNASISLLCFQCLRSAGIICFAII